MKPISPAQIDALMPFLEKFEDAEFSAGNWIVREGHFPWFAFGESAEKFVGVLYENDWITPRFNWTEWKESAGQYVDSPKMIESADATTIQKLLTTHIRFDRFCEGHLASMFECGHILALLHRLRVLRSEMAEQ